MSEKPALRLQNALWRIGELEAELVKARNLATILDESGWALQTFLPMKREAPTGGSIRTGYLIPADRTTVRRQDALDERYESIEAMLDAGWRVD